MALWQGKPKPLNYQGSVGRTLQISGIGFLSPRASRGGDCAHGATEHAQGQDSRTELQVQHVGGGQLRLGVELCAAWETHLCISSGESRATEPAGLARDRKFTQDEGWKGVYLLGLQLVWPYVLPFVRNHSSCVQFP